MMVLTGIAQESDFMDGTSSFFLVFNKGELRLPVPEETAAQAVQYLSAEQQEAPLEQTQQPHEEYEEGAEIFSSTTEQDFSDYAQPPDHDVTESEEDVDDGVGQI